MTGSRKIRRNNEEKGNFLGNLFAILIFLAIVSCLLPLIKIAIAIFVIWVVLVVISCLIKHTNEKQYENTIIDINSNQYVFSSEEKQASIKRQVDILVESIQLVNESNNLDTVLRRYLTVYNTLNKLLLYTDDELRKAGYNLKQSIPETQNHMLENRVAIINQAIERNIKHDINSLKTINGKVRKLDNLYEKMKKMKISKRLTLHFLKIYIVISKMIFLCKIVILKEIYLHRILSAQIQTLHSMLLMK